MRARTLALAAGAGLAAGLAEAARLERRVVDVPVPGLPAGLDGLRIGHLSDPHLGSLSLNGRVFAAATEWLARMRPDVVAVTGDLLARHGGEGSLRRGLAAIGAPYGTFAVLGNVDVAQTRDPFSGGARVAGLGPHAVLLEDEAVELELRGSRVRVAGLAAGSRYRPPASLASAGADLEILLAHFPESVDRLPAGGFQLVLSGHTHGGQLRLPWPGGRLHLAEFRPPFRPPYPEGVFELPERTLVVSRGTGTTFVPFRLLCRPEVAVLVLRSR